MYIRLVDRYEIEHITNYISVLRIGDDTNRELFVIARAATTSQKRLNGVGVL